MGLRYCLWKRRVRKYAPAQCSICCICNEPIYPGTFVGVTSDQRFVHAGFHFSPTRGEDAFCESGAIGSGFWTENGFRSIGESAAAKVMRTGEPVLRTIGPDGIKDT